MAFQTKAHRIYLDLLKKIEDGQLPLGTALPPERELAKQLGVAVLTLRRALEQLRNEGWITSRRYHGTHISSPLFSRDENSKVVGLIAPAGVNALSHPVFSRFINGVEGVLCESNYVLDIAFSNAENPLHEQALLKKLEVSPAQGWLVSHALSEGVRDYLAAKRRPVVLMHHSYEGLNGHFFEIDFDSICQTIFAHLSEQGYTHIWVLDVAGEAEFVGSMKRAAGPHLLSRSASLQIRTAKDSSIDSGREAIRSILSSGLPIDAVVCVDDELAIGVSEGLQANGICPPKVGVIGAGDFPIGTVASPRLTTISHPYYSVGREAGRLLIDLAEGIKIEPVHRKFLSRLIIRESTQKKVLGSGATPESRESDGKRSVKKYSAGKAV